MLDMSHTVCLSRRRHLTGYYRGLLFTVGRTICGSKTTILVIWISLLDTAWPSTLTAVVSELSTLLKAYSFSALHPRYGSQPANDDSNFVAVPNSSNKQVAQPTRTACTITGLKVGPRTSKASIWPFPCHGDTLALTEAGAHLQRLGRLSVAPNESQK